MSDKKEVILLPHNEEAYQKLVLGLKDKQFVSINHATGTGKSFIVLKYLLNNRDKRILYLAPTYSIVEQLVNDHVEELGYSKHDFMKFDTMLYSGLLKRDVSELARGYDIVILDEYHRCGAEQWGEKIKEFISTIRNEGLDTKVIGTTATEIRYLDNKRDMNELLFDGNCVSRLSLAEAILRGILPVPVYVNVSYELNNKLSVIENRIKRSSLSDKTKAMIFLQIHKIQREVENMMLSEKSIHNYLEPYGKYLVFSSRIDRIYQDMMTIEGIIPKIDNEFIVSSDESRKKNLEYLRAFRMAPSNENTVLYSVNLLNEGVHVKDVDAVFMLRMTSSPIIYFQQLGRLLSYSKRRDKVVVFDFVNNYRRHNVIYDVYIDVSNKAHELMISDPANKERYQKILDNFQVVDYSSRICQKILEIDKKYSSYNIAILTLDETIDMLEGNNNLQEADAYWAYINLYRYQKYATIEMYDRVSKLKIKKPGIFGKSREEFVNYLAGYENIVMKNANKYRDLYIEVIKYYDEMYHLPSIFSNDEDEKRLAQKLLEGFDYFTIKMQNKIKEYVSDELSILEKITYGGDKLPNDRLELYREIDNLLDKKMVLGYNLISTLRFGTKKEDKTYLFKVMASNDKMTEKVISRRDEMEDDSASFQERFGVRKELLYREKFFIIVDNVRKEFNDTEDKEKYIDKIANDIISFMIDNQKKVKFNVSEDITSEDILYVKKVVFRDYLDKIGFDKMEEKASKSKKIKFDDLFIFMDNHMGCLPYVRSDDKMEQILARKYLNHKNEMSYSDRVRFCEYINKYTKERYALIEEYLEFIKVNKRKPLPFNENEKELVDSFMRAKAVLPEEYLNRIDKIIKGLDPKVEFEAILEFRNRKIKK